MKKENDELFNLFRSRVEHAEVEIRDNFWEQLERDIPVVIRNRRRFMIQRVSAAASVLLILAGVSAAFWHFSPKDEIADAFSKMEIAGIPSGTIKNDGIKEELPSIQANAVKPAKVITRPQSNQSVTDDINEDAFFSVTFSLSVTEQIERRNNQYNSGNSLAGGMENVTSDDMSNEAVASLPITKSKKNSWAVGLSSSTNVLNEKENRSGLQMLTGKDNALNISNRPGTVSRTDFLSDEDYSNYLRVADNIPSENQYTNLKHKLPVSVGVSLRKYLSDRFSLESGLVYTQLNSELTGGKDNTYYQQNQTLHYLGIPLKANFNIIDSDHFDLYASAGGMIEKSISGNITTDYYDAGKNTHSSKHSLNVDPLQLSVTAALGVQYKFNERISVYAEPGLAYYFDDGSPVSTIRKEKPLNFNMLCGVRMTY